MGHWTDALVRRDACAEAVKWARNFDSLAEAWSVCQRGDWMLWLAGRCADKPESEARRQLARASCECARLALPHVPAGEDRPRLAIEATEAWARGEAPIANVRAAYAAAYAAYVAYDAVDAAASYAYDAVDAAAYAAYAADAYAAASYAVDAAAYAAYAADAAYAAASYAVDAAASYERQYFVTLATCADIVRRHYPEPPELPWETQKE